uniref:AB hydrolase-1 domain-containing protein n=1 Tax=Noccaea caerulescens TaxID=107243 RepID=A0A1J3J1Y7_NOCCA
MSGEGTEKNKKSAASARSHTRNNQERPSSAGLMKTILLVSFVGALAWVYQSIQPPPPKIAGSPGGAAVTSPRIKLRDGRHLAYKESGIPRDEAKFKIIYIHGFDSCMHDSPVAHFLSPDLVEELRICTVSLDRPGYGESDPDPNRSPRSIALDIEELADGLGLGPKFYVFGLSMGGEITWACLKYIPHRLAGAALVAPAINYWWRNLPGDITREAFSLMYPADQWALRVAHYAPWLTFWWNTQKWFPISNVISGNPVIFSRQDLEVLSKLGFATPNRAYTRQQGEYESLHRDLNIGFSSWEFDPLDLQDPFPNNNGSVHLWHGDEDKFVPVKLQRYIASKLPWIRYHEISGSGHLLPLEEGMTDKIIKSLLGGEEEVG